MSNSIDVHPSKYTRNSVHAQILKPEKLGEFSVTQDRKVVLDHSQVRCIWPAFPTAESVNFDLNDGLEKFEKWPSEKEDKLDIISEWLMRSAERGSDIKEVFKSDLVTSRGVIKLIALTPYQRTRSWSCVATQQHGVIYMYWRHTEQQKKKQNGDEYQRSLFQAHKFKQCVTIGAGQEKPDPNPVVSDFPEFRVVVRTTLFVHAAFPIRILMSAEVDSLDIDQDLVEITTNSGSLNWRFWRYKSLNNWMQCVLVGATSMLVGIKDEDAIVNEVKTLSVTEMKLNGGHFWDSGVCYDVLHTVLTRIRNTLENNKTCIVEYTGKVNSKITIKVVREGEESVLNEKFTSYFELD